MQHITENHILVFLAQLFLLLGCARALGELFRRWGQPTITAEILVGILLGPTLLGRSLPQLHARIFPADAVQVNMLETLAWMGILFFLLKSGLETNFTTAWRQRGQGFLLSLCDLIIPVAIAFVGCLLLPDRYAGEGGRMIFSLFVAVIMTISALPVTARIMQDLRVYRTDMGLLIMSALTINDVAGWIVFAMILGFFSGTLVSVWSLGFILAATVIFSAIFLALGPALLDRAILFIKRRNVPEPAGSLTLVCLCGLAGGAITTWIGIHALFGFFIAGIMAGESKLLSEHTRHIFSQMVQAILVPIFFASIGLKLDFLGQFDLLLAVFILVIGVLGRYVGAVVGARLIRQPSAHGRFIGWAHVPGGEMQIVIGMVALEYGVIAQPVYVAIVFGAILSSVIAGPLMKKVLRGVKRVDWLTYLPLDHVLADLACDSRDEAVAYLCDKAGGLCASHTADAIARAVHDREREMTTALGDGIAAPHARLNGLDQPLLLFARSKQGIEWNASDGKPVRLIFLLLTPVGDESVQLRILQGIAQALNAPRLRAQLLRAPEAPDIIQGLRAATSGA